MHNEHIQPLPRKDDVRDGVRLHALLEYGNRLVLLADAHGPRVRHVPNLGREPHLDDRLAIQQLHARVEQALVLLLHLERVTFLPGQIRFPPVHERALRRRKAQRLRELEGHLVEVRRRVGRGRLVQSGEPGPHFAQHRARLHVRWRQVLHELLCL